MQSVRPVVMWTLLAAAALGFAGCGKSSEDVQFQKTTPELVSPVDGHVYEKMPPRSMALEWRAMPGAVRYEVEIEMQNVNTGVWMPAPVEISRTITDQTKLFTEFPGAQPGRWRVTGISAGDTRSQTSDWWRFEHLN